MPTQPLPPPDEGSEPPPAGAGPFDETVGIRPDDVPRDETVGIRPDDVPNETAGIRPDDVPDGEAAEAEGEAGPATSGWRDFGGRNMPVAIASGLGLVAVLIGTLVWSPAAFTGLVLVLLGLAIVETGRSLRRVGVESATPVVLVAAVIMLVGTYRAGFAGLAVGVAVLLLGAFVWEIADGERDDVVHNVSVTVFLGLWMPFLASFAVLLVTRPEDGWVAVIAAVAVPVVADIGGFVVGTRYGRRRLAPSLSPKKSWEGVVGGVGLAVVVAAVVLPFLGATGTFDVGSAIVFALVVAAAGVLGDLTESMVKRDAGVKDLGGIVPGHGGVIDRVDSILFALPAAYYVLALLGR